MRTMRSSGYHSKENIQKEKESMVQVDLLIWMLKTDF